MKIHELIKLLQKFDQRGVIKVVQINARNKAESRAKNIIGVEAKPDWDAEKTIIIFCLKNEDK